MTELAWGIAVAGICIGLGLCNMTVTVKLPPNVNIFFRSKKDDAL